MNHKDYKRLYSKFSDRSPLTPALNLMHKTEHAVLGTVLMAPVDTIMHHSEDNPHPPLYQPHTARSYDELKLHIFLTNVMSQSI